VKKIWVEKPARFRNSLSHVRFSELARTRNSCKRFLIAYLKGRVGDLWRKLGESIKQLKNSEEFQASRKLYKNN